MTLRIVSKMKRIAIYVRLSTVGKGQDPETQLMPLREWVASRGHGVYREYVDLGWSGAKERRPMLDMLMADARKKHFDVVLVARFDRFARSTKHLLTALSEFESLKIDFISLNESIDTTTAMGRMVFTIFGAIAEFERNLIRERVLAGVDRARKQGKKLGRPTVLVDRIRVAEQVAAGVPIAKIARDHGIARSTVRAIAGEVGGKASQASGESPLAAVL